MLTFLFTLLAALAVVVPFANGHPHLLHNVTHPPHHVHRLLHPPPTTTQHSVILTLTQSNPTAAAELIAERSNPASPHYLQWVDKATLSNLMAPQPISTTAVTGWVQTQPGVTMSWVWGPYVEVTGSVAAIQDMFNTTLRYYFNIDSNDTVIRSAGESWLPSGFDAHIQHVDGLHTGDIVSPVRASPHHPTTTTSNSEGSAHTFKPTTIQGYYTSAEISSRYGSPNSITATATNTNSPTSVGVIQLQNTENYNFNALYLYGTDQSYAIRNLTTLVTGVELIGGAVNSPSTGSNDESMLDVEAVIAVTTTSKFYAMLAAGSATQPNQLFTYLQRVNPLPQVMSLSYSYVESQFSAGTLSQYESQVQALTALGVTFLAATGDSGYNSGIGWPATSAYVLAVGGTHFSGTGSSIAESAWTGSTGGLSAQIARPSYQTAAITGLTTSYRAVPDVSALADTWYIVYGTTGHETRGGVGGTSLATPLFAGIVTYLNAISLRLKGSTLGFINPLIYQMATQCSGCLRDITTGTSNGYSAKAGYDLVTGLGSPNLPAMEAYLTTLLSGSSTAGAAPAPASSTAAPVARASSSSTAALRGSSSAAAPVASSTGSAGTQCTLSQTTAVGTFNNANYNYGESAAVGSFYTSAITTTATFALSGLGIQLPAASTSAGQRATSVIQLGLYRSLGNNQFSLLATTASTTVSGTGGNVVLPISGGSAVSLSAGTYYVAVLVSSSTSSSGVLLYANGARNAVIGPMYTASSFPTTFTATYGNYPFRAELLACA